MAALSDPKLELFAQAALRHIAHGMARGKAADVAAKEAGYGGSSRAANARKRINRADVKARMVELAAPMQAEAEADLSIDVAKVKSRLAEIILAPVVFAETVLPKDVINAARQLAAIEGWNAPTNVNLHDKRVPTDWTTAELVAFIADERSRADGNRAQGGGAGESDRVH